MNEQQKNIHLPYEIGKLAFEKGFTEWCKSIQGKDDKQPRPNAIILHNGAVMNVVYDYSYLSDDSVGEYGIPTYLQLIVWLKDKHNIDVTMQINGFWRVIDTFGNRVYFENETEFEINQALEIALNTLPNFQHDK